MKIIPEWQQEPKEPPKIWFDKDIYYRTYLAKMKIKWENAEGLTVQLKNPSNKVFWKDKIKGFLWKKHEVWLTCSFQLGIYVVELIKDSSIVASDAAILKKAPSCEANERFCVMSDLWRCVDGEMKVYEKNSSYCIKGGFRNTGYTVPDKIRLPEGSYNIMITKKGYKDFIASNVSIEKGKTTSLAFMLSKKPWGDLTCNVTPKGARIWIKKR